jgi:uncharacterized protein YndB with AHSA1/START domain
MRTSTRGVVEIERRIAARPETVFSYFTDPERYRLWQGTDAELDPRPGGLFRITMTGRSGAVARGEYVEIERPKRLVFTWGWEPLDGAPEGMAAVPPGGSEVEIVLIPDGEGTILRVRHTGLPTESARRFHAYGWDVTLPRLEIVAAGGEPGPDPFADI